MVACMVVNSAILYLLVYLEFRVPVIFECSCTFLSYLFSCQCLPAVMRLFGDEIGLRYFASAGSEGRAMGGDLSELHSS